MSTITLYLVRHGESQSNVMSLLSSYPEIPGRSVRHLTARGIRQAEEAAQKIKEEAIDVIIASPMTRTKETAEYISQETGVPIYEDIRLRETDFGAYNSQSVEDFFQKYLSPEERVVTDGSDGVESATAVRDRVESFLSDVWRQFAGKKVVLVSHADTLEQIHGRIVGESISQSAIGWSPETGSVTRLEWNGK